MSVKNWIRTSGFTGLIAGWIWLDVPTFAWWIGHNPVSWWVSGPLVFARFFSNWHNPLTASWYGVGTGLLIWGYWGFMHNDRPRHTPTRLALIVVALLASQSMPFASHDIFAYYGEVVLAGTYHLNPMTTPITAIPHWQSNPWLIRAGWQRTANPYGPLWFLFIAALGKVTFIQFFWIWKASCLTAVAAIGWLLNRWGRRRDAFILHPAVGIELLANGHNDVLMLLPMVLGYWYWTQKRWILSGVGIGISIGIKYVSLVLLPVLAIAGMGSGALVTGGLATCLPLMVGVLPFWSGWQTVSGPLHNTHLFLRSPQWILQGALVHIIHWQRDLAQRIAGRAGLAGWLSIHGLLAWRFRQTRQALYLGDALVALAVLGMSWMQYWYLTWALPFYFVDDSSRSRAMVMALSLAEIIRASGWFYGAKMPIAVQLMEAVLLWLVLAYGTAVRLRHRPRLFRVGARS